MDRAFIFVERKGVGYRLKRQDLSASEREAFELDTTFSDGSVSLDGVISVGADHSLPEGTKTGVFFAKVTGVEGYEGPEAVILQVLRTGEIPSVDGKLEYAIRFFAVVSISSSDIANQIISSSADSKQLLGQDLRLKGNFSDQALIRALADRDPLVVVAHSHTYHGVIGLSTMERLHLTPFARLRYREFVKHPGYIPAQASMGNPDLSGSTVADRIQHVIDPNRFAYEAA